MPIFFKNPLIFDRVMTENRKNIENVYIIQNIAVFEGNSNITRSKMNGFCKIWH